MDRIFTKRNGIIAAVIAVIVVGAVVVSTTFSQALTLDEAKEIAKKYVPASAKFITSEEEENKYEVMFHDDAEAEGFEVEVHKDTRKVKKVESQKDNDRGGKTVKLTEKEVKEIIKKKFSGVTSVSVSLKKDNGLYEYEADFKSNEFYGDAEVHPETGVILESTVKYGTAVTIPTDDKNQPGDTSKFLSYDEVEKLVIKAAGGGFVKDIDLEKEHGKYIYEVELIKDHIEYDYIVDPETGKVTLENEHDSYFDYDDDHDDGEIVKPGTTGGNGSNSGNTGNSSNSGSSSNRISYEKAKSIVLAKIPGATITKLKLEKDDGIYIYEGEAILNGYEYEFEINASSGVIIDWDKERIDDDDDDDWDDDWDDDDDDDDWDD
ncbi:PepSY domain-containing protein [Ihubacter sp. rT4E-8]|uniref:PepSY domain-containing protein n=1 Tax=Ihubacter sp. rT4E-8 TaxID=3242369 RepID=UPI003CF90308